MQLSPSALGLFKGNPLAFWLEKNRSIKLPRGMFSSLPGGMDRILKEHYDSHRNRGMIPMEIEPHVEGILFQDGISLKRWRNWRTTELRYVDKELGAEIVGALDDLIVIPRTGEYSPLDYKTRGAEYPTGKSPAIFYQHQLDCYAAMLNASGYKSSGRGYIASYYPSKHDDIAPANVQDRIFVPFRCECFEIRTSIQDAVDLLRRAVECLNGPMPELDPGNPHFGWFEQVKSVVA